MKKHYVVILVDGYYKAKNKKDAMNEFKENDKTLGIILSQSKTGNYYHNRVHVVA